MNYGNNTQNIIINKNFNIGGINNNKDNQKKNIKPKIPTLKFPLDKIQTHQKFSLIRTLHLNDFNKSRDGSSTTTKKNKIFTNKLAAFNRHFLKFINFRIKRKIKRVRIQLGESCLACDFTSLINQKIDYEIEKYKKKNNGKENNKNKKDEELNEDR